MNYDAQIRWFLEFARSFILKPYIYGGDDMSGIDCSGLVVECLKGVGRLGHKEDLTAHGLWLRFADYKTTNPRPGNLAFWHKEGSGHIHHVAICLDSDACITADGGGKKILSTADAIKYNAFVKIRPVKHRTDPVIFVNIFKEI